METKVSRSRRPVAFLLVCLLALLGAIGLTFPFYQNRLSGEFQFMERELLTSYAMGQSQKAQTELAKLQGRLRAAANLLGAMDLDPQSEEFSFYIQSLTD